MFAVLGCVALSLFQGPAAPVAAAQSSATVPLAAPLARPRGTDEPAPQTQPAPQAGSGAATDGASAVDAAALAAFQRMCAKLESGQAPRAIASFRLKVAITTLQDGHPNQDEATLAWHAPDAVRLELSSGRQQGKAASGYWLKDAGKVEKLVGRDYADDRRSIDELAAMCHNFALLARAREWKLSRLVPLAKPPAELPHALADVARSLDWIELASPEFLLVDAAPSGGAIAPGEKDYVVQIGLVRADTPLPPGRKADAGEPFLLALCERRGGIEIRSSALLLALGALRDVDGLRVPGFLYLRRFEVHPLHPGGAFEESPSVQLGLAGGSRIGVELADADFEP